MSQLTWIALSLVIVNLCNSSPITPSEDTSAPLSPEPDGASKVTKILGKFLKQGKPSPVERYMAKNRLILEDIASNHVNESSSKSAFHNEETVAVVYYLNGAVDTCKLMEITLQHHLEAVLQNLTSYMPVYYIGTKDMVNLIVQCQQVGATIQSTNSRTGRGRVIKEEKPTSSAFLTAIVPGTKWCGAGDIAQSYEDLGHLTELDKCCRAHDHCPIKVNGMASAHGLINLSLYTKSHCACDDEFFTCLKMVDSHVSRMIGNLYFNVIQVPCVDEEASNSSIRLSDKFQYLSPELCTARNARSCSQPIPHHTYKFVQLNREF